jgi:hypothetical protein
MLDKVIDLADRFGVIDGIKDALLRQPDKANAKLAEVLDELARTVAALDDEMVRYLSLHFHSEESIRHGRTVLLGMEVGQSIIRINELRGHCHKIKNVYDAYLDKWFDRVFSTGSAERNQLATAFAGLGTADDVIIEAMTEVSAWLKTHAEQTLNAVDTDNLIDANMRIRQARLEAKAAREKLIETMGKLRGLQADLIAQSGTV